MQFAWQSIQYRDTDMLNHDRGGLLDNSSIREARPQEADHHELMVHSDFVDFVEWSKTALERLAEKQKSKWVQLENGRTKPKDAVIVFASETQIEIELPDDLGELVPRIEVNADARNLLYKLSDRLSESRTPGPIALKLALGKKDDFQNLGIPPNERDVIDVASTQDLTFVWDPRARGRPINSRDLRRNSWNEA